MLRFFGGISLGAIWRAPAVGVAVLTLASLFAPDADARDRRDNLTLQDIQKERAARAAKLADSRKVALPIVITPASVTAEQVEPIAPVDDAAAKQTTTQEVAATAEEGVADFPSMNDDISVDDIQVPSDLTEEIPDPIEPLNRFFFGLNEGLDFLIVRPVAIVYRTAVPKPLRIGIGNALRNAATPIILANDILQGAEGTRVEATMVRFMLNSTLGIGGLVDVGSYVGLDFHREDFGQTLAVWGVGPGPYMVAPILGPGNPRDFIGIVVDTAINPMTWILADEQWYVRMAPSAAEMISTREISLDDIDSLRKTSPDFYVTVRQLYNEKRTTDIANGDVTLTPVPGMRSIPPSNLTPVVNPF